jgi:NAD(P)H dehydrogenase (quinone)
LLAAEVLVLVFPTWWFAMPAMLKGWFDRVWALSIAYNQTDTGALLPRLHGLKRTIAITTLGSPWWVDRLVLRRPVRKVLKRAILGVCAPKSKLEFLSFYGCEKLTEAQVTAMKERVSSAMGRISTERKLQAP